MRHRLCVCGCVCVCLCVRLCVHLCQAVCVSECVWYGGMLYLCELKGILHTHGRAQRNILFSADLGNTRLYLLNYYNSFFSQERCALLGHGQLIGVSV